MLQLLLAKRLPGPDPSQKMSGLLRPKSLATTELLLGAVPPNPRTTTTPPEKSVGPVGTLPEMWLPVTSTPRAPKSEMPTPEIGGDSTDSGHDRVLSRTWLALTPKLPEGPGASTRNNTPRGLLWTWFPAMVHPRASRTKMPNRLPYVLLPTTFAFALGGPPT